MNGEILSVSQFTLYADVKGNRPGFSNSKNPDQAVKFMSILMMRYERMVLL